MNHKKHLILQLIIVIGLCFAALGLVGASNGTQAAVNGMQPLLGTQLQSLINSGEKTDLRQFQETILAQEDGEYSFISTFIPPPSLDLANFPYDLAFDQDNNLYMIPWTGTTVKKYNLKGELLAEWGGYGEEYGDYEFYAITGIAVDINNNVYVVDYGQDCVKKFDSNGNFLTKWGQSGDAEGEFNDPWDIAISHDGFVYVTDILNSRIQKFDTIGNFILEWGESGDGDGEFNWPQGITISYDGFVYVADTFNNRIQKFDSNGNFILEWGESGDGEGQFNYPEGITVSQDGFIFVADKENKRIQKFDSSGNFIVEWESGRHRYGRVIQPTTPTKLAIDKEGFIFVADGGTGFLGGHNQLQKFDLNGNFISEWGRGYYGSRYPLTTKFNDFNYPDYTIDSHRTLFANWVRENEIILLYLEEYPGGNEEEDIAVDKNGNVWVIDPNAPGVEKYTSDGYYITQWLPYQLSDSIANWPLAVTKDQYGHIYIVDCYLKTHYDQFGNPYRYQKSYRIKKFDENGGLIISWEKIVWDKLVSWNEDYSNVSLAVDNEGYVYLALRDQNEIYKFNSDGTFLIAWDCHNPAGMAVDLEGHIYISDVSNHLIEKYDTQGTLLGSWGNEGGEDGEFQSPQGLSVDVKGNIYVADSGNHRIQKFDSNGNFITKWGSEGDGELEFSNPHSLAVDDEGFVYVIDTGNDRRIQKFGIGAAPSVPTGVVASDGTFADRVRVSWNAPSDATFYKVFRNTSDITTGALELTSSYESNLYDDFSAVPETTYYYWIKACNSMGCSEFSSSDKGWIGASVNDNFIYLPLIMGR